MPPVSRIGALSHTCPTAWYVVGSGASGSWAVKELTEGGLKVVLFESGTWTSPMTFSPTAACAGVWDASKRRLGQQIVVPCASSRASFDRESGGEPLGVIDTRTVDRTNLHRLWKAILVGIALVVAAACYFVPVLLVRLAYSYCCSYVHAWLIRIATATFHAYMLGTPGFMTTHIARLSAACSRICGGAGFEATRCCGKHRACRNQAARILTNYCSI